MELLTNSEFYDRETAELYWHLEKHGTMVPVYSLDLFSMIHWCRENCDGQWAKSPYAVLIDQDIYQRSIQIADGVIPNPRDIKDSNWIEAAISDAIMRDQEHNFRVDMAKELGFIIPAYRFWFVNKEHAMLFKLTWGGE